MAIPDYTLEALQTYIQEGVPTGSFLYAVLTNDLKSAAGDSRVSLLGSAWTVLGKRG